MAIRHGFDGLSNTHVVGNEHPHRVQLQGHEQRHELIGPGLHGDPGKRTERSGTGAKAQANGIPQQPAGAVIADLVGRREVKLGRFNLLQREVNAGDFIFSAAQGPEDQQVFFRLGQDNPFPVTGFHKRTDGIFHYRFSLSYCLSGRNGEGSPAHVMKTSSRARVRVT